MPRTSKRGVAVEKACFFEGFRPSGLQIRTQHFFPPLSDVWVLVLNASRPPPPSPPPARSSSHASHFILVWNYIELWKNYGMPCIFLSILGPSLSPFSANPRCPSAFTYGIPSILLSILGPHSRSIFCDSALSLSIFRWNSFHFAFHTGASL